MAECHAVAPRVLGSIARGGDEPGSVVDILVDFTDEPALLDEIGFRLALADLLRVDVDVIAADSLQGRICERVPPGSGEGVTVSHRMELDAAERVVVVCDVFAGLIPPDVDALKADVRTEWAVQMGLIRIGEAVNRIPSEVRELFPQQPWRQIVASVTSPHTAASLSCVPTWSTG